MHDLSFFLGKNFFGDDSFKNVCLSAHTQHISVKRRQGLWLHAPLYFVFLHSIKLCAYRIRTKFDNSGLVVEENHYRTKIVNAYNVYNLNNWPKNPVKNFKLKKMLAW